MKTSNIFSSYFDIVYMDLKFSTARMSYVAHHPQWPHMKIRRVVELKFYDIYK